MLDIQNKRCLDTKEDVSKIVFDPHVLHWSDQKKFDITPVKTGHSFPSCQGTDELIVLKPFNGPNTEYKIFHNDTHERGFLRTCPRVPVKKSGYCLDHGFNQDQKHESTVAVICGQPKTCIRTCCKETAYHSLSEGKCTNYQNQPENWRTDFTQGKVPNAKYIHGAPCTNGTFQNETDHEWYFESDGSLYLDLIHFTYDQYCLNNLEDSQSGTYTKQLFVCSMGEQGRCHGPYKSWLCSIDFTLLPILMGISLVFLVLLQWIIWSEKKDKLYECMQLCSIWMLALVYLTLIILKVSQVDGPMCEFLGTLFHFAYMSSFFWLSAMSHFVYNAFKGLEGRARNLRRVKYGFLNPKFRLYALYGFGCPALVTLLTIILNNVSSGEGFIAPRIGNGRCTLGQSRDGLDIPMLWYFHIINILTLVSILGFFGIFVYNMTAGFWADNALANTEKERAEKRKQRMKVVIKMFFVMGLSWIADIISWGLGESYGEFEVWKIKGLRYTTLFFQIINSSQVSKE